jgi:hypothetical protein
MDFLGLLNLTSQESGGQITVPLNRPPHREAQIRFGRRKLGEQVGRQFDGAHDVTQGGEGGATGVAVDA